MRHGCWLEKLLGLAAGHFSFTSEAGPPDSHPAFSGVAYFMVSDLIAWAPGAGASPGDGHAVSLPAGQGRGQLARA